MAFLSKILHNFDMTALGLVELLTVSPSIILDIRYATSENMMGRPLYSSSRCFLQKKSADRLHRVQMALRKRHLGLKVFDGYRPLFVQKIFWAHLPDPRFVADPAVGSNHNRGAAVDLTLIDENGRELMMPSGFDEMSERSSHNFHEGAIKALSRHREILKEAMIRQGFMPFPTEWWHFDDPEWASYPVIDIPIEKL